MVLEFDTKPVAQEKLVQEIELQDEEDRGAVAITEKTSQSTPSPHEMSDSEFPVFHQNDNKVELRLPRSDIVQIVLLFYERRSRKQHFERREANASNAIYRAQPTSIVLLKLVGSLLYSNRFPFDPGGHFSWPHISFELKWTQMAFSRHVFAAKRFITKSLQIFSHHMISF